MKKMIAGEHDANKAIQPSTLEGDKTLVAGNDVITESLKIRESVNGSKQARTQVGKTASST